jgi:GT2 family glycosyltransferase
MPGGVYNRQQSRVKTVTIAIPSLHRPDLTARCLEFIQQETLPPDDWEVVVIENEAQPESILPDPLPLNTRRIELPNNEGTTGSINRAVAATESRYILLLNNDVELQPDYVAKLVGALDSDSTLGFATGKLLRATERSHLDGAGDAMLLAGAAYRLGHFDRDEGQYDRPRPILSGCGAAVLYRREAFELCGRLDEDFFAYLEDFDLALRAHLLGYAGLYLPDAVAYHVGSATLGDVLHPRIVEYLTRNQLYLLAKNYPHTVLWRLLPRIVVYQCLWLLFALQKGGAGAYFRGWWAGLRGWTRMRRRHRDLMAKRRVTDDEFLARLRESERQIYEWQQSRPPEERSGLLKVYFGLFGKP